MCTTYINKDDELEEIKAPVRVINHHMWMHLRREQAINSATNICFWYDDGSPIQTYPLIGMSFRINKQHRLQARNEILLQYGKQKDAKLKDADKRCKVYKGNEIDVLVQKYPSLAVLIEPNHFNILTKL